MDQMSLFTAALGLKSPWEVVEVAFEPDRGRIDFQGARGRVFLFSRGRPIDALLFCDPGSRRALGPEQPPLVEKLADFRETNCAFSWPKTGTCEIIVLQETVSCRAMHV
ncbi:MAG: hypothetical protein U9Q81_22275 [Pseudomonadota bacterium]|nr:hypothetical protein [Pseudomonadota bacterium]